MWKTFTWVLLIASSAVIVYQFSHHLPPEALDNLYSYVTIMVR